MTQSALAVQIGETRSALSQAETGTTNSLTAENLVRAAQRLGKNPTWLATGEGVEKSIEPLADALLQMPNPPRDELFKYLIYRVRECEAEYGRDKPRRHAEAIEAIRESLSMHALRSGSSLTVIMASQVFCGGRVSMLDN